MYSLIITKSMYVRTQLASVHEGSELVCDDLLYMKGPS